MFTSSFYSQLHQLSSWQQTAFIIALTQRTAPNYQLFSENTGFVNAQKFKGLIELVWQSLMDPSTKVNFELQQEKLEALIPDIEDFDIYGVYPALDSCVLLSSALNASISPSPEEADNASNTSLGTIIKLLELQAEQTLSNDEIKTNDLFREEQIFQQQVLNFIEKKSLTKAELKQLRLLARNNDISNIGISL